MDFEIGDESTGERIAVAEEDDAIVIAKQIVGGSEGACEHEQHRQSTIHNLCPIEPKAVAHLAAAGHARTGRNERLHVGLQPDDSPISRGNVRCHGSIVLGIDAPFVRGVHGREDSGVGTLGGDFTADVEPPFATKRFAEEITVMRFGLKMVRGASGGELSNDATW